MTYIVKDQTADQELAGFFFREKQDSIAKLITPNGHIVTVIGNDLIRRTFEAETLRQIATIADAPGITKTVINADAHPGFGCPIGSVFSSPDLVYPNAVGPDVKCSMSFLQFNIPKEALLDSTLRSKILQAIEQRVPTGIGNRMPVKARTFGDINVLKRVAIEGASKGVLQALNIPLEWADVCEDASHGNPEELEKRLDKLILACPLLESKLYQLGGVGGGNHFLECNVVEVESVMEKTAKAFSLINDNIGFLCHFGSRGFGYSLTSGCKGMPGQFNLLSEKFDQWRILFPGNDKHNVYVPVGTIEATNYLNDMALASNFATINHLLICTYIMESFTEVLGDSVKADLVYYIAHNIIRREVVDKTLQYVHRKGATRAYSAGHHELKNTRFYDTGHPILLPGNPIEGSTIMVGQPNSAISLNSVNHGAGRTMGRRKAKEIFLQEKVNNEFKNADIITNCAVYYPIDECREAYKSYGDVIGSVEAAGLAKLVARLRPVINIKDNDTRKETSA